MDKESEKLYAQLGGIGTPDTIKPAPLQQGPGASPTSGQDESLDHWRTVLVELAYLLNASFRDAVRVVRLTLPAPRAGGNLEGRPPGPDPPAASTLPLHPQTLQGSVSGPLGGGARALTTTAWRARS